jgi:pimeloyl-ACP methyl ester carboxylesterase
MANKLAYQTAGDPSRHAIMLVHGFMSCSGQWLCNVDALSKDHYLVMIELWGHGDSPTPRDEACYSISSYLAQFEHIREVLGIHRWSVIGQSYGAGLVINYALQHPERCDAVVVTNSRSAFGKIVRGAPVRKDGQSRFDPRSLPFHPIHARRFPQDVKDALVEKADGISAAAIKLGGLVGDLNSIETLGKLEQPVLLTNGRYEKSFQADLDNLLRLYPDLNVADLDGGHSVNIEAAEGFNAAVLRFLTNPQESS